MKTVVKTKNLLAFRIWFEKLGYEIKSLNGRGFTACTNDRRIKKKHHYVRVDNNLGGNSAAFILGEEFENHLVGPLDVNLEKVA